MDKATLLRNLQDEHARWEALLAGLPPECLSEPDAIGQWSIKDLLAHVSVFEMWTADQLAAVLRGETNTYQPSYVPAGAQQWSLEQQNAAIYVAYRDRSLAEVLAQIQEVRQRLAHLLLALPEEALMQAERYGWTGGQPLWEAVASRTYRHQQVHRPDLEAWLRRVHESSFDERGQSLA
jgi:hypothetical protein